MTPNNIKELRELFRHIGRIFQIVVNEGQIDPAFSIQQLIALNALTQLILASDGQIKQRDLVQLTAMSRSTVSRYIREWIAVGWLIEVDDPDDFRSPRLVVSDFGWDNAQKLLVAWRDCLPKN